MTSPDNCPDGQTPNPRPAITRVPVPCAPGEGRPDTYIPPNSPDGTPTPPTPNPKIQVGNEAQTLSCSGGSVGDPQTVSAGAVTAEVELRDVLYINTSQLSWFAANAGVLAALASAEVLADVTGAVPILLAEQAQSLLALILAARVEANANAAAIAAAALLCVWENTEQTASCPGGASGGPITVAAGEVTSTVSLADANARALAQAQAGLICTWTNEEQSANCVGDVLPLGSEAVPVDPDPLPNIGLARVGTYTVAAGAVSSNVSQEDANERARQIAISALVCFYTNPSSGSVGCTNGAPLTTPAGSVETNTLGNPVNFPAAWVSSSESSAAATADAQSAASALLRCVWTNPLTVAGCPNADPGGDNVAADSSLSVPAVIAAGTVVSTVSQADMEAQLAALILTLRVCIYCNQAIPAKCDPDSVGTGSIDLTEAVPAKRFCDQDYLAAKALAQAANAIPVRQLQAGTGDVSCRFSSSRVVASCNAPVGTPVAGTLYIGPLSGGAYHTAPVSSPAGSATAVVEAGAVIAESQADANQVAQATALALLDCYFKNVRVEALCGDTLAQFEANMGSTSGTLTGTGAGKLDGVAVVDVNSLGHPMRPAIVLAGTYTSSTSIEEANRFAVVDALGRLNCFYYNINNPSGTCESPLVKVQSFALATGRERSEVSQADADARAVAMANALVVCVDPDDFGGSPGAQGPSGTCDSDCSAVYS